MGCDGRVGDGGGVERGHAIIKCVRVCSEAGVEGGEGGDG